MMANVTVRNLTKSYPNKKGAPILANDSLSFEVNRGEMFGLLGPNGAGKTTLVMQLLGLIRPTSGEICVEDVDVVKTPDRVQAAGRIFATKWCTHAFHQCGARAALYRPFTRSK